MELLFTLFMTEEELIKSSSVIFRDSQLVVSGSKPEASSLAPPFPTEAVFVIVGHELAPIVPPILSPSKQQNRESLIFKPSHGGEETGTPVLLLPSQIFPSTAEGNIVLCKNEGSLSADRGAGSRQGGDPNEIWDALQPGISVPERINAIRTQLIVLDGIFFPHDFLY